MADCRDKDALAAGWKQFLTHAPSATGDYEALAYVLSGPLNQRALSSSLGDLVASHPSLALPAPPASPRSLPFQRVSWEVVEPQRLRRREWQQLDLRAPLQELAERLIADLRAQEQSRSFFPYLIELAPDHHVLLLIFHYLTGDATACATQLLDQLGRRYNESLAQAKPASLSTQAQGGSGKEPQPTPCADVCADQVDLLALALGGPRLPQPEVRSSQPQVKRQFHRSDLMLRRLVSQVAERTHVSLDAVVAAGLAVALGSQIGTSTVGIGWLQGNPQSTFSCRWPRPLCLKVEPTQTVRTLLRQVAQAEAQLCDPLPIPTHHERGEAGAPSYAPGFAAVYGSHNRASTIGVAANLSIQIIELERNSVQGDLTVTTAWSNDYMEICFQYLSNRIDDVVISRMRVNLIGILLAFDEHVDSVISDIPLLSQHKEKQILHDFNQTNRPFSAERCVHQLFEDQVRLNPNKIAVRYRDHAITYIELDRQANQLAHYLVSQGVKKETRVGVCMGRSIDMVVAIYAILKSGGAYVPILPDFPIERISFVLHNCDASLVISESHIADHLHLKGLTCICFPDVRAEIQAFSTDPPFCIFSSEQAAYSIYTSGSTGQPKGITIQHNSLVNLLEHMCIEPGISADDILLAITNITFDMSVVDLFWPLVVGATLIIAENAVAADGRQLAQEIERTGATIMQSTPATFRLLFEAGWKSCKRIRLLSAGEPLPAPFVPRLLEQAAELWNLYGPTEATVYVTIESLDRIRHQRRVTVGRPIANTRVYIVDFSHGREGPDHPHPVGIGRLGELCISGVQLARGYLNRPEMTKSAFIQNPFSQDPHDRMYRTGDLACWQPDGTIELHGRIDHQVKVRGFRVELGEIEAVLLRYPSIAHCATQVTGEGDAQQLIAYLVCTPGRRPNPTEISNFLKLSLPSYMIPTQYMLRTTLPLTTSGKVDRKRLSEDAEPLSSASYVEPRTDTERQLAALWSDILGIHPIGIDESFFNIGGQSILAARLVGRIAEKFLVTLPLLTITEYPTVAQQADIIDQKRVNLTISQAGPLRTLEELLSEIERLTPEEVQERLRSRR